MLSLRNNRKRIVLLIPLLCMVSCALVAVLERQDYDVYLTSETRLQRTIVIGMSRQEVHKEIKKTNEYNLVRLFTTSCGDDPASKSVEWFSVRGSFRHWVSGYLCYDESGKLVYARIGGRD
jgi:hypothetical protein